MLLPSALSCDSTEPSDSRSQPAHFVSPPASPPTLSTPQSSFGNIMGACRSLQALMASSPAPVNAPTSPPPSLASLPTPPLAHAPPPPRLRLRTTRLDEPDHGTLLSRRRIAKRAPTSPKSNKRRRFDEPGEPDQENAGNELNIMIEPCSPADDPAPPPSTPKRARIAPEQLPLGLARSDFHNVYMPRDGELNPAPAANQEECGDGDEWSAEDDRILVELILDKLRLSKTDWQDCARSLGKDRHSVSKRWKSLLNQGDVGLKARGAHRRPRLHATWR